MWPVAQFSRDAGSGATETRFAGPLVQVKRKDEARSLGVHPLFLSKRPEPDHHDMPILWPLSRYRKTPDRSWFHILPVVLRRTSTTEDGTARSLWLFPIFYWAASPRFGNSFAVLPFYGHARNILGRDLVKFILFPIWLESTIGTRKSWNFLWPFFGGARDADEDGGAVRVWPFYARRWKDDQYDRTSILWPFLHFQRNRLHTSRPTRMFMFFPFYGRERGEDVTQTVVLWPFFGHTRDDVAGVRVTSAPWPILQWKDTPNSSRFRFWPFYGRFDNDELRSRFYVWPFFWNRKETTSTYERESKRLFPFWRQRHRIAKDGSRLSELHIWPLLNRETDHAGTTTTAFPALNPFVEHDIIDELYSPLWTLYRKRTAPGRGEQEALLGAVRHRWSPDEEVFSLPWIYSSRRTDEGTDRSILLGLIRTSSRPRGAGLRVAGLRLW